MKAKKVIKNTLLILGILLTLALSLSSCNKSEIKPLNYSNCDNSVIYKLIITTQLNNITSNNCQTSLQYGDKFDSLCYMGYKSSLILTPSTGTVNTIEQSFNIKQKEGFLIHINNNTYQNEYIQLNVKIFCNRMLVYNMIINPNKFDIHIKKNENTCVNNYIYTY